MLDEYNTIQYNTIQLQYILVISVEKFVYSPIKTIYKLLFTLDFIRIHVIIQYTDIK